MAEYSEGTSVCARVHFDARSRPRRPDPGHRRRSLNRLMSAPIDPAFPRREMVGPDTRERRSPEAELAVRDLLTLRSRWIEGIVFDTKSKFTVIEKLIAV